MRNDFLRNRNRQAVKLLSDGGFDALILPARSDVRYLTGFGGSDSWAVLTAKNIYLITDSRYIIMAKHNCSCKIVERTGQMSAAVAEVLNSLSGIKKAAADNRMEIRLFNDLAKKLSAKLRPVASPIFKLRTVKDASEISAIKKAAKIAQAALDETLPKIRTGISEAALAAMLDTAIKILGGRPAFETIVAFGPNSAAPHHIPTAKKLKKTDTVLIDFGAEYKGLCSDITRCFAVGKADNFYSRVYSEVLAAQSAAIKAASAGQKASSVDFAARDVLRAAGLPDYGHGTGHGLGFDIHEGPVIAASSKDVLAVGNCFTIEPGVYLPGKFGIRIEDDILITEKGRSILTCRLQSKQVPVLKL